MLNREQRIDLARAYHADNAIIQNTWRKNTDGRELVCALAAFGTDINSANDCPADLMPQWMAELVPSVDDGLGADDVHWFSGELIDRAAKWHVLDDAAWERIRTGFLIAGIKQAIDAASKVHTGPDQPAYWQQVLDASNLVIDALNGVGDLEAAAWAARAAAWAAGAAAGAAWAAGAAEAAAWAAAWAAEAAGAAAWAAEAAGAAAEAAGAAAGAAEAAWKALAKTLFALIDVEISVRAA